MKNLKDDNYTGQTEAAVLFKNLPTDREADELESSLAEYTPGDYSGQRITERTISKLHDAMAVKAPKSNRRRRFQMVLIAACVAVLLIGTVFAAAEIIHNRRLNDMLGIKEDAGEMENAFFEIGISKQATDDLTITVVDSIGDSRSQWIEVKTNKKLEVPVEDGWLPKNFDYKTLPANLGGAFSVKYSLENGEYTTPAQTFTIPFCRDGDLWYMIWATADDSVNNADVLLKCGIGDLEFRWKNNYEADEKTVVLDRTIGKYTYTKVVLSASRLVLCAEKDTEYPKYDYYNDANLESITLADGTLLPLKEIRGDGPVSSGGEGDDGKIYREFVYLLLPNHTFETPDSITSIIPKDDIVTITIGGIAVPLR